MGPRHGLMGRLRELRKALEGGDVGRAPELGRQVARDVSELVFRENRVLYPTLWALLDEGMWAAVHEEFLEIGLGVKPEGAWRPGVEPKYPYQVSRWAVGEALEKLSPEVRRMVQARGGLEPDEYELVREGDIVFGTGFLPPRELRATLNSLPVEITFADREGRVRFYSRSRIFKGFARVRGLLGEEAGVLPSAQARANREEGL